MSFITEESMLERLAHNINSTKVDPISVLVHDTLKSKAGRKPGVPNLPMGLRAYVGAHAALSTAKSASEGICNPETGGDYKLGIIGRQRDKEQPELNEKIENILSPIRDKAVEHILTALHAVNSSEIENASLKTKLAVAESLSKVVKNTLPRDSGKNNNVGAQIVFMTPQPATESQYETVTVKSSE